MKQRHILIVFSLAICLTACNNRTSAGDGKSPQPAPGTEGTAAPAVKPADPEPRFPVMVDGKFGYMDEKGKLILKPSFDAALSFSEDRAAARDKSGKWGYIDKTGKFIIKPEYEVADMFSEGLAGVMQNGKYGFINPKGEFVIQPKYAAASKFRDGVAMVVVVEVIVGSPVRTVGFIKKTGEYVVQPILSDGGPFSDGLAAARWMGEYFSYVDTSGKKVILSSPGVREFQRAGEFSEGLAPVLTQRTGVRWGYINRTGDFVIDPKFLGAQSFSEGLAAVQDMSTQKWGFIDKTGKTVISYRFKEAGSFLNGLAQVTLDGKLGYIDKKGDYVWTPKS